MKEKRVVDPRMGRMTMRHGDHVTVDFTIEMPKGQMVGKVVIEDLKVTYRIVAILP